MDWRDTLKTLLTQFDARAATSSGLHHLFVEVANDERDKMQGPNWFDSSSNVPIIDGTPKLESWTCSSFATLPGEYPSYRAATEEESKQHEMDGKHVKDASGRIQAVFQPQKLRVGYFCGPESPEASKFESLANSVVQAISGAEDLHAHYLSSELIEAFRRPSGGVRYIFGDVPAVPNRFIAQGWNAGVAQFEDGVLIDVPVPGTPENAKNWVYFLHKLGWRTEKGGGISAVRTCWSGDTEAGLDFLNNSLSGTPPEFARQFENMSKESFYSVLGTKEAPLDLYLASAFAIRMLLAELDAKSKPASIGTATIDYSGALWAKREPPKLKSVELEECKTLSSPKIGVLVATDVERMAILKKMRPPKGKRTVAQVFFNQNTFYVGRLGVNDIVVCMVAMGSVGRDSSALVTAEFIDVWRLRAIVMAGIAFGKDPAKQNIGQVLISDRVISYEPQRVGEVENQNRGEVHSAGITMLNRFRNSAGWSFQNPVGKECGLQFGPMLSGEKLVDNAEFKAQLFERYPSAIGGEMEGVGLASAATRKNCEWIVVKAICDWGDGSKQKVHQEFSAAASISLIEHIFNQPGSLDFVTQD